MADSGNNVPVYTPLHGQVSRDINMGFYVDAARKAYHGTQVAEEREKLIRKAMERALEMGAKVDCTRIAGEFGDYISGEQRKRLLELVEKSG